MHEINVISVIVIVPTKEKKPLRGTIPNEQKRKMTVAGDKLFNFFKILNDTTRPVLLF